VPNITDAEDLLQQTNIEIWRQAKQFQEGTNFLAWARTIAKHKILHFRRQRQRDRLTFDDELAGQIADLATQLAADESARVDRLHECLKKLPASQRQLIQRRYSAGAKLRDLAAELGLSMGNLAVKLHRIRRALKSCVDGKMALENS